MTATSTRNSSSRLGRHSDWMVRANPRTSLQYREDDFANRYVFETCDVRAWAGNDFGRWSSARAGSQDCGRQLGSYPARVGCCEGCTDQAGGRVRKARQGSAGYGAEAEVDVRLA